MSSRRKSALVIGFYVLLLVVSLVVYRYVPHYREELKFWLPQVFLLVLIAVTTLYVIRTGELVEETKRLQQRPLLSGSFCELTETAEMMFEEIYAYGSQLLSGAVKVIGGQEKPPPTKYLAIELNNVGHATAFGFSIKTTFQGPDGQSRTQEKTFPNEIAHGSPARIIVAPAAVPWMLIRIESLEYSDGLRAFSECIGNRLYDTKSQVTQPQVGRKGNS